MVSDAQDLKALGDTIILLNWGLFQQDFRLAFFRFIRPNKIDLFEFLESVVTCEDTVSHSRLPNETILSLADE